MTTNEELIAGLNQDLAGELGAIVRYTYQSSQAFGPGGAEVRKLFKEEIQDELEHASYLMDVIVDLGGDPVTAPMLFEKPRGLREMLELDYATELQDSSNYAMRAQQAEELNKIELKVRLEEMAADEAEHARKLHQLIKGM